MRAAVCWRSNLSIYGRFNDSLHLVLLSCWSTKCCARKHRLWFLHDGQVSVREFSLWLFSTMHVVGGWHTTRGLVGSVIWTREKISWHNKVSYEEQNNYVHLVLEICCQYILDYCLRALDFVVGWQAAVRRMRADVDPGKCDAAGSCCRAARKVFDRGHNSPSWDCSVVRSSQQCTYCSTRCRSLLASCQRS